MCDNNRSNNHGTIALCAIGVLLFLLFVPRGCYIAVPTAPAAPATQSTTVTVTAGNSGCDDVCQTDMQAEQGAHRKCKHLAVRQAAPATDVVPTTIVKDSYNTTTYNYGATQQTAATQLDQPSGYPVTAAAPIVEVQPYPYPPYVDERGLCTRHDLFCAGAGVLFQAEAYNLMMRGRGYGGGRGGNTDVNVNVQNSNTNNNVNRNQNGGGQRPPQNPGNTGCLRCSSTPPGGGGTGSSPAPVQPPGGGPIGGQPGRFAQPGSGNSMFRPSFQGGGMPQTRGMSGGGGFHGGGGQSGRR